MGDPHSDVSPDEIIIFFWGEAWGAPKLKLYVLLGGGLFHGIPQSAIAWQKKHLIHLCLKIFAYTCIHMYNIGSLQLPLVAIKTAAKG